MRFFYSIFFYLTCVVITAQVADVKPTYLNYNLSIEERVEDIVSRMTMKEKASQMVHGSKEITRLGIPAYNWWNECLHGVARAGVATVFPQAIGLAATWNTDLIFKIADVISTEARAKHHDFVRKGDRGIYKGLTFWSPNINIFRDPRWGRGQETYGEDPYLTSRIGVAFIKGLQGDDPNYYKVIATPKHYAVHSGPEPDRHTFDAITNNRDLYKTYLPAFEATIKEGKAYSIMCAYNRYMGEACCGSPELLQKILRDDWGFQGYVVSDCWAINDIFENHKIVKSPDEAVALAIKSGTDLECGNIYDKAIIEAVNKGYITENEIDISLKRLFTARFKLGMFDPPELVKYTQIPIEVNDSEDHRKLSIKAAQESIVLLKNENNILPLKKDYNRILVVGPTADSYEMLLGNYHGIPSKYVTPLQGIKNKVSQNTQVIYEVGSNLVLGGAIRKGLSSDLVSYDGVSGLKVEYFDNPFLDGKPQYTTVDQIDNPNWIWNSNIVDINRSIPFSLRWSGVITVPSTGEFNFILSGKDGYRLIIDDKKIIDNWNEQEFSSNSNSIRLEKGKSYNFKIEYFKKIGRPELIVEWESLNFDSYKSAIEASKNSDVIIFVGGITPQLEGEEMRTDFPGFVGGDRTNIDMPKVQEDLLKLLAQSGKPIVLVLTSGSALSVNWAKENIPAIVQIWYPGQEGGTALADILFGDYNPAGRLPVTFYKFVEQLPPFEDYNMEGRTYRYFNDEPLYPFGYGLSYAKFEYSNLKIPSEIKNGENVNVSIEVKNIGDKPGDEVVQLYVKDLESKFPIPIHSLQGFQRVHLKAGETKRIDFELTPKQLSVINDEVKFIVESGDFEIFVGGHSPGISVETTSSISKIIKITGEDFYIE